MIGDMRELTLPSSVMDFHFRPSFAVTSIELSSGCFFCSLPRLALQNRKYAVAGALGISSFSCVCVRRGREGGGGALKVTCHRGNHDTYAM